MSNNQRPFTKQTISSVRITTQFLWRKYVKSLNPLIKRQKPKRFQKVVHYYLKQPLSAVVKKEDMFVYKRSLKIKTDGISVKGPLPSP